MAATTYTASSYGNQPKYLHAGNFSVSGKVEIAATSVTDVWYLAKVPHGATIVDLLESHTTAETAGTMSFGLSKGVAAGGGANASCLILGAAGVKGATTQRFNIAAWPIASNWPPVVSLSDLDPVRYAALTCKPTTGSFTLTCSLRWTLIYRMDGPPRDGSEI